MPGNPVALAGAGAGIEGTPFELKDFVAVPNVAKRYCFTIHNKNKCDPSYSQGYPRAGQNCCDDTGIDKVELPLAHVSCRNTFVNTEYWDVATNTKIMGMSPAYSYNNLTVGTENRAAWVVKFNRLERAAEMVNGGTRPQEFTRDIRVCFNMVNSANRTCEDPDKAFIRTGNGALQYAYWDWDEPPPSGAYRCCGTSTFATTPSSSARTSALSGSRFATLKARAEERRR